MFRTETVENCLHKLSELNTLPQVCVIDLNFHRQDIIAIIKKLRTHYPTIKLIAHSDIDDDKVGKALLNIGFSNYLILGSDIDDFKRAIDKTANGYHF